MNNQDFTEHDPVNMTELATAMRYSRQTVYRWIAAGYVPEFGHRTSIAHCKAWLRNVYQPVVMAQKRARKLRKRIRLGKFLHVNLSKSGASLFVGRRGATVKTLEAAGQRRRSEYLEAA